MSTGLKEELGLGEPAAESSSEQAEAFRADFQDELARINEALQYLAAYAESSQHAALSIKRDKACEAYQVALSRIDPADAAVAASGIDQVTAALAALSSEVDTVKQTVEKSYTAWQDNQDAFERESNHVREMVEWGHQKAATLQQVVDVILAKSNERKYAEAHTALSQLQPKSAPLYEDFLRQKSVQEEYQSAWALLEPQLPADSECEFQSLQEMHDKIASSLTQMHQAAEGKNFEDALENLQHVELLATDYSAQADQLRDQEQEYEKVQAELEPKIDDARQISDDALAEYDNAISDGQSQLEQAAAAEDHDQATEHLHEIASAADNKIAAAQALNEVSELSSKCGSLAEADASYEAGTIYFKTNEDDLGSDDRQVLDWMAANCVELLAAAKEISIAVDGYADDRGDANHNQQLSERRAAAVASYLETDITKKTDVDNSQLADLFSVTSRGRGEQPAGPEVTSEQRAENRRADVIVTVTARPAEPDTSEEPDTSLCELCSDEIDTSYPYYRSTRAYSQALLTAWTLSVNKPEEIVGDVIMARPTRKNWVFAFGAKGLSSFEATKLHQEYRGVPQPNGPHETIKSLSAYIRELDEQCANCSH